jgi:Low-density lipoprotein receptor repeat class B
MLTFSQFSSSLHYMPITTPTPPRQLLLFRSSNLQPMDIILKQDRPITRTCPLCSHLTLLKNASHTCSCPTGVGSIQNSCKSSIEKFLLIARSTEIRLLSLDVPSPDVDMSIPGLKHVLSIDYYNKTIYYTDDELRRVASYSMDTKRTNMIVSTEIIHPDGLCIDKSSKQIYWTDAGTDKIEVCSIDGRYRKSVVSRGLYEPRALAVDSLNGLLFWSDWGRRPKIEYSYLDGSGRTILVNSGIEWPNGLAVDEDMKKLYFCDASTDRIESINYDGGGRIILLQSTPPLWI